MNDKKVCIIISQIDRWMPFEWIYNSLDEKEIKQSYILITEKKDTYFYHFLKEHNCSVTHIPFLGKKNYLSALKKIYVNLEHQKPNVVHCHFLDASILGLFAAYLKRIPKRIYTRHHGIFHHEYHPKGVWLDKLCNKLSTQIIAISDVVKQALNNEGVKNDKINVVHHGFKIEEFEKVDEDRRIKIINNYHFGNHHPIVGVVARHIEWKGIQYIIPAFKKFLVKHPKAKLILANARGSFHLTIIDQLKNSIPESSYSLIPFEKDIQALFKIFDLYLHVPINATIEAFGQTYIEALAAGIPSIFTKSGIANDFIEHKKNALVVPFKDSESIYKAMIQLMENPSLCQHLINNGKTDVQQFGLRGMIEKLLKVYNL